MRPAIGMFTEVHKDDWPTWYGAHKPIRFWRSKRFLVHLYRTNSESVLRLTVQRIRTSGKKNRNRLFTDGITWDELQAIKNAVGFSESDAIEMYPRIGDVVNDAKMRHLWVMANPVPFAWRPSEGVYP